MAYIYKITNDINQKIYIGKTEGTIQKRFKQHCKDYQKETCKNRPLYRAMNKYGIEHFHIEEIEYVPENVDLEEREIYWIEYYGSFKYGYNATLGGDGKHYLDYDLIIATYKELQNIVKTAKQLNIDTHTVGQVVKNANLTLSSQEVNRKEFGIMVNQYDINGNYIQTFATLADAVKVVAPNTKSTGGVKTHIGDVCKGKRKTAYGYIWRYAN